MLLHYLGKLEVQVCRVSKSAPLKIESQRSYCPLMLMFSMFKTERTDVLSEHKYFYDNTFYLFILAIICLHREYVTADVI